jgi:hypothetical protein
MGLARSVPTGAKDTPMTLKVKVRRAADGGYLWQVRGRGFKVGAVSAHDTEAAALNAGNAAARAISQAVR